MPTDSLVLRLRDVADLLDVTEPTVRRLIRTGELQATRVGHFLRVERSAIDDYLARNRLPAPAAPGHPDLPDELRKYL